MNTRIEMLDMDFTLRTVDAIYRDAGLNSICGTETVTKRNIAHTLQLLGFYESMLSLNSFPRELEASLCRNIVILGYSVLDAIIICAAYEIQDCCRQCPRGRVCRKHSTSLFESYKAKDNEKDAFVKADAFLKESGLLLMTDRERALYDEFRQKRNSIHLTKFGSKCIPDERCFTRAYCNKVMGLLKSIAEVLEQSVPLYKEKNGCPFSDRG